MPRYGKRLSWGYASILWLAILLGAGSIRRWVDSVLAAAPLAPLTLEAPLSSLRSTIDSWTGTDVPVDERVLKVAGTDDHVNRRYSDSRSGASVNFYVGYVARPVNMLGHRPETCYPAHGWVHRSTQEDTLLLADGRQLPCLVHRFQKDDADAADLVVLNYYVLQGRYTAEWTDFWGPAWRRPNLARDPNYYVAQVQVVGSALIPAMFDRAEAAVRQFAALAAPEVEALLPKAANAQGKAHTAAHRITE
jgi:EpsI family protein